MKENEKIEKETETGEKKPAPKKEPSKKPAKSKEKLKAELEAAQKELTELKDQHLRTLAEYDNFRKRTVKEKEELSAFCVAGAIEKLLPALDALDAAAKIEHADVESLKQGIELVKKTLLDGLGMSGVELIPDEGEFDPNLHNALMHIEDENLPENSICEVFQKGYQVGGKVIRHSLVKVAN